MDMDDDFEIIAGLAAAVLSKRYYGDFVAQQCQNWELYAKMLQCEKTQEDVLDTPLFIQDVAEHALSLAAGENDTVPDGF